MSSSTLSAQIMLPSPSAHFVGRTAEIADINTRLVDPACRLLTLIGYGGIGKTQISLQVAYRLRSDNVFRDGVYFVPLAGVQTAEEILPTIARSMNEQLLMDDLAERELLLILDNFEHLYVDGYTDSLEVIRDLMTTAPHLKLLVTSRVALNLRDEWLYPISGLQVPQSDSLAEISASPAVQMFANHARRFQPDFDLKPLSATVAGICRLVDGMPLAIELAASWMRALAPADVLHEIRTNLDFLASSSPDVPERHKSIRAVFNHTWQLLNKDERKLFQGISVFRGTFDRYAAEQVIQVPLTALIVLVDKSLIRRVGAGRYECHELLRQFAAEKLDAATMAIPTYDAHSLYYAQFLYTRKAKIQTKDPETLAEVDQHFENIAAAWKWMIQRQHANLVQRCAESLFLYCRVQERWQEEQELLDVLQTHWTDSELPAALQQVIAWVEASDQVQDGDGEGIDSLSPRELEILRLIAADLDNPQIAEKLVVGVSTVKKHINHIFRKLGVKHRYQAITLAEEHGLI